MTIRSRPSARASAASATARMPVSTLMTSRMPAAAASAEDRVLHAVALADAVRHVVGHLGWAVRIDGQRRCARWWSSAARSRWCRRRRSRRRSGSARRRGWRRGCARRRRPCPASARGRWPDRRAALEGGIAGRLRPRQACRCRATTRICAIAGGQPRCAASVAASGGSAGFGTMRIERSALSDEGKSRFLQLRAMNRSDDCSQSV